MQPWTARRANEPQNSRPVPLCLRGLFGEYVMLVVHSALTNMHFIGMAVFHQGLSPTYLTRIYKTSATVRSRHHGVHAHPYKELASTDTQNENHPVDHERIDAARRMLELTGSAKNGYHYAVSKNRGGDFESAFHMLTDVVTAFVEIKAALPIVDLAGDIPVQEAGPYLQDEFHDYLE